MYYDIIQLMKSLRPFLSLILISLSLTSCSGASPDKVVSINGDLLLLRDNEINYDNAFRDVNLKELNNLILSNEKFVFYLTSSECSHCLEFQDKIVDYIQKTRTMVCRMDIIDEDKKTYSDEFIEFFAVYKDYFFVNEKVLTPQVYVVEGKKVAQQVPSSRYAQKWMFKRAMKDYVETGHLYSFTNNDAYEKFRNERENKEYFTIYADKTCSYYIEYNSVLREAKRDVAIIETEEGTGMVGYRHLPNGEIEEREFGSDTVKIHEFLDLIIL